MLRESVCVCVKYPQVQEEKTYELNQQKLLKVQGNAKAIGSTWKGMLGVRLYFH